MLCLVLNKGISVEVNMKAVLAVIGWGLVSMVSGSIGEEKDDSQSNIQVMSRLNF